MKKILVIGSSGFIGQHLIKQFLKRNFEIVGIDKYPPKNEIIFRYRHVTGDILSIEDLTNVSKDVKFVISLAAKHHDFGITKEEYFRVNEGGTINLLNCMSKLNIKNLIFYSSVAVYGTQDSPTIEESPLIPDTDYGRSKLAAENAIKKWAEEDKTRSVIIIRPTVIFGPENYGNVYNLIDKIYKKRFIFVGDGSNIKSVAYVENLVDATLFLMDYLKPGLQIFNYSDEPQMTTREIVGIITEFMPHSIPKFKIPLSLAVSVGGIFDVLAKISGYNFPITAKRMKKFNTATHHKAEKIRQLGFKQRISIKEGFKRMIEWYLTTQSDKKRI
uniref:NAD(P)-dependent oxidoreductase n=1 Tax=candidate division WOR-3 bacterium TaxID=2052148 RepID=A0A7V1EIP2_UNCW3